MSLIDINIHDKQPTLLFNNSYEDFDPIVTTYDHSDKDVEAITTFKSQKWSEITDLPQIATHGNLAEGDIKPNNSYLTTKLICENNLKFEEPILNYLYYDIESYKLNDFSSVPHPQDNNSYIAIISLVDVTNQKITVYLNDYERLYQDQVVRDAIKLNDYEVFYKSFSTEQKMCECFFADLSSYTTPTIISSFNGSMGRSSDRCTGYDLPFIHSRARIHQDRWQLIKKYGMKSLYGKNDHCMITQLRGLPNVFFYDYKYLYSIIGKDIYNFKNYKLSSYCSYYKVSNKLDINQSYVDIQRILASRAEDISLIIAYCIKDCLVLHDLEKASSLIADRLSFITICNVSLHQALYFSYGQIVLSYIIQQFYNQKLLLRQRHYPIIAKGYDGAFTKNNEGIYSNAVQFDVKGMYPNIIVGYNISPETISLYEVDNSRAVDISNDKELGAIQPTVWYDRSRLGVVPSICLEFLTRREETKRKMKQEDGDHRLRLSKIEKALKLLLNSIYGCMGFNSSSIYNIFCAASITAIGRDIIQYTRDLLISKDCYPICIDTDGVSFKLSTEIDSKTKLYNLLTYINDTIATVFSPRIILELDDVSDIYYIFYAPPKNKSYCYISYSNIDQMFNGQTMTEDQLKDCMSINGVGWSAYGSDAAKQVIKQFFFEVMRDRLDEEAIRWKRLNFYNSSIITLQNINSENYKTLLSLYAHKIKLGTVLGQQLKAKYNLEEDTELFIPIIKPKGTKLSDRLIPLKQLTPRLLPIIDVIAMTDFLYSPIKKFFSKPSQLDKFVERHNLRFSNPSDIYYRNEGKHGYSFHTSTIYAIYDDLTNNPLSYHEIITEQYNRAFFDIDSTQFNISHIDEILLKIHRFMTMINYNGVIAVASASTNTKLSLHIVLPMLVIDLNYNSILANNINRDINASICDLAVYSIGKSLRMPLSFKYHEGRLVRQLTMIDGKFEDMIIKNITHQAITETPFYFSDESIFDVPSSNFVMSPEATAIIEAYAASNNITLLSSNNGCVRCKCRDDCLICGRPHDSDNQYFTHSGGYVKMNCYRNDYAADKKPAILVDRLPCTASKFVPTMTSKLQMVKSHEAEYDPYGFVVNKKYIDFDIKKAENTYISSALGTGKTEALIKQLDKNSIILLLTFRRTFASDITRRYNDAGFNFVNYLEDRQPNYDNCIYKQLVLQIDSLHKYCVSRTVDVVICDEIESILSQLKHTKDFNAEVSFLCQLFQSSRRVVFLDGHLNLSTINLMQYLAGGKSMNVIHNMFKPKTDYECVLRPISYNGSTDYNMFCYIYHLLSSGKRIAMMCSSITEVKTIILLLKDLLPDKRIKCYTGADADKDDSGLNQRQLKLEDFSKGLNNVFIEQQPDLLIYTGTLTSGVSVDIDYFDQFIGCLFANTTDVLSFVQSIHRVRSIRSKKIEIYLHHIRSYLPTTIGQINLTLKLQNYNINETKVHVETFLQARANAMKVYSSELLLTHLNRMGYKITIEDEIISYDCPITRDDFKTTKVDVNPKKQVKKILEKFIEERKKGNLDIQLIRLSEHYIKILSNENMLDMFVSEGGNDTVYRDKHFLTLCRYSGLSDEIISNYNRLETVENAMKLLFVQKSDNFNHYKNLYYNNNIKKSDVLQMIEDQYMRCQKESLIGVAIGSSKVAQKIDQMLKLDKAKEIIEKVDITKFYSKDEFEAIVTDWIKEVKDLYPELKLNHNSIKTLNEFCSRLGYMWESKQVRRNGVRVQEYKMQKM